MATTTTANSPVGATAMPDLHGLIGLDDASLLQLSRACGNLRIERDSNGGLHLMAPTGSEGSSQEMTIGHLLLQWCGLGKSAHGRVFSSSGGFSLQSGRVLAADAAFVSMSRWQALSVSHRRGFAPIAPDFVIELLSPSDSRPQAQAKMQDWIEDGVKLGWLIDPGRREVHVYRPDRALEVHTGIESIAGDDSVLPGFVLDLTKVWPDE